LFTLHSRTGSGVELGQQLIALNNASAKEPCVQAEKQSLRQVKYFSSHFDQRSKDKTS